MTTIVLIHPSGHCPKFQLFAVYDASDAHHVFALQEIESRYAAEKAAHAMMETYEADHFRRVIVVGEPIG